MTLSVQPNAEAAMGSKSETLGQKKYLFCRQVMRVVQRYYDAHIIYTRPQAPDISMFAS